MIHVAWSERDVEIGLDRRQGDDDHRDVQRHEEDAERQREQRDEPVLAHRHSEQTVACAAGG